MVKARKYVVKKHFQGVPKRDDFEIVEEELPALKNGEILVKSEWISVDPSQRMSNVISVVPYDQSSFQVALVQESKNPKFPVGTKVVSEKGWRDYSILNPNEKGSPNLFGFDDKLHKLPDLHGLPESVAVGAAGMPGVSAYFGFLELCKPKAGETVVVTGAAGAVGSLVGQIAKIKGCRVIGLAGSDEKVAWLEKDLGFDKAINYKTADIAEALKAAAPKGVDCYFDNVGGEISSIIIGQMNVSGRVSVCGCISSYNEDFSKLPKVTILQPAILMKKLKIEGFWYMSFLDRWDEAMEQLIKWLSTGQLKTREHVTTGFDNIFDAFIGMLAGENIGKAVVKV